MQAACVRTADAVFSTAIGGVGEQLAEHVYRYAPAHYLVATAELPVVSQIRDASPERPYLSLRMELDPVLVGSVMVEAGHLPSRGGDVT